MSLWILSTHQMTQEVICIIASDKATKKSCSGFPFSFSLPMVTPRTTLNMTRPSTFVPSVHSDPISHVAGLAKGINGESVGGYPILFHWNYFSEWLILLRSPVSLAGRFRTVRYWGWNQRDRYSISQCRKQARIRLDLPGRWWTALDWAGTGYYRKGSVAWWWENANWMMWNKLALTVSSQGVCPGSAQLAAYPQPGLPWWWFQRSQAELWSPEWFRGRPPRWSLWSNK